MEKPLYPNGIDYIIKIEYIIFLGLSIMTLNPVVKIGKWPVPYNVTGLKSAARANGETL